MNFIKKSNVYTIVLTMLYMIFSCTTVFAAETQLVFSSPSCNAGEEAVVEISLPQNSGVISVQLELEFDDELTLVDVSDGEILGAQNHKNTLSSPYVLSWENDFLTENITSTGTIATLTFKVSSKAASKSYPVKVVRAELLDKNINEVPFDITEGSIKVSGKSSANGGSGGTASGSSGESVKNPTSDTKDSSVVEEAKVPEEDNEIYAYSDVKENDWFYSYVMTLSEKGVVSGNGNGEFAPNDNVTREQFLKMLLEAVGTEYANVENTFADVDNSAWYAKYVLNAKKIGIVNGVSDVEFGIGENITRQDMAVMISRTIEKFYIDVSFAVVDAFDDSDVISDYAKKSVNAMKSIGLIEGYNNKFRPIDNLTRAEAAKVISELIDIDK